MVKKTFLFIIYLFIICSTAEGQAYKKDINYARQKYAEFIESGVKNDSSFLLLDTINKFQINLKENTIYTYSSTQLNVVNQDESGISYLLIFGKDDRDYLSLAKQWDKKFSQRNPTFKVKNIDARGLNEFIVEHADIQITINGKKMAGKMKTIQTNDRIYILQVMTFKNRWKRYNDKISEIVSSFETLD